MKLKDYQVYSWGKELSFVSSDEVNITVAVRDDSTIKISADDEVNLEDMENVIGLIKSGKVCIEL